MISLGYIVTTIYLIVRVAIFVGLVYLLVNELKRLRRKRKDESNGENNTKRGNKSSTNN